MTRSRRKAIAIALLLGGFGIQRFYVGRNISGTLCFYCFGLGFPLVIGVVDAIRWLRMSDAQFAARYGFAAPRKSVFLSWQKKLLGSAGGAIWHLWKAAWAMSFLIAPMIFVASGGEARLTYVVIVAAVAATVSLRVIGRHMGHAGLRCWLDPLGAESAGRICRPMASPISVFLAAMASSSNHRRPRWDERPTDSTGWHHDERSPAFESPAINPATGLYMSGPGTSGFDTEGNIYGQSHENDFDHGWSDDHWR